MKLLALRRTSAAPPFTANPTWYLPTRRSMMKAIRIHQFGDANTLKLEDAPNISIVDDQLLVRVRAAGVNPIDWKIRQGYMKDVMPTQFPLTIGQDFAGEVVDKGKSITQFTKGDRVFGFAQGS